MGTGSSVTAGPKPDTFHFPLGYSGSASTSGNTHDDTDTRAHTWRASPLDNLLFTVASLMPVVSCVQQQVSTWFLVLNHLHVSEKETFTHWFITRQTHSENKWRLVFITRGFINFLEYKASEKLKSFYGLINYFARNVGEKNTNDCHVSPLVPFTAFNETDNLPFTVENKWIPFSW